MTDVDATLPYPRPDEPEPTEGADTVLGRTSRLDNTFERYHSFAELGAGGIGTVRACLDPNLGRLVALKYLHPHLQEQDEQRTRFIREARVMARIEHPNIVPVHELGTREDGSIYFTMKRVQGVTLQRVLTGLKESEPSYQQNYPLSRLLDVFEGVCQAVAFAHSKNIIHRDLKPANILVGAFGEVLLLDWGLAKFLDEPEPERDPDTEPPAPSGSRLESTLEQLDQSDVTLQGSVSGTPLYMSPEQASGRVDAQDARSDLYSLGAILYEILTLEFTVHGGTLDEILEDVTRGEIRPPRRARPDRNVPRELGAICMKALAKKRDDRYPGVLDMVGDLDSYRRDLPVSVYRDPLPAKIWKLARRHPVVSTSLTAVIAALLVVFASRKLAESLHYTNLMAEADVHREAGTKRWGEKRGRYQKLLALRRTNITKDLSAEEVQLEEKIADLHLHGENEYDTAIIIYLLAAREDNDPRRARALTEIYSNRLEYALMAADYPKAARLLDWLRTRLGPDYEGSAISETRALLKNYERELQGDGTLAVTTDPPGATVTVFALRADEKVGVLEELRVRGPIVAPFEATLPKGSYLVTLNLPDRPEVRHPVRIGHGATLKTEVRLPTRTPPGTVYVPAGPFLSGGRGARYHRRHERRLEGFFIAETEVTIAEYLDYWRATRGGPHHLDDRALVRLDRRQRCFLPAWDDDGNLIPELKAENPVVGLTRDSAERYCAWLGRKLGRRCRLPTAHEWEKAARGVDGRAFVWGEHFHPGFAFTSENKEALAKFGPWAPPRSFPRDRSIYRAWDLGGNVREYTGSRFPVGSPFYQIKGASASTTQRFLLCAYSSDTPVVPSDVGFRYVIEMVRK